LVQFELTIQKFEVGPLNNTWFKSHRYPSTPCLLGFVPNERTDTGYTWNVLMDLIVSLCVSCCALVSRLKSRSWMITEPNKEQSNAQMHLNDQEYRNHRGFNKHLTALTMH